MEPTIALFFAVGTRPDVRTVMEPPLVRSLVLAMSNSSSMTAPGAREVRASLVRPLARKRFLTPSKATSEAGWVSQGRCVGRGSTYSRGTGTPS